MTHISARLQLAVYALAIVVGALISSFVGIAHAAPDAIVAFDHAAHFPALTSPLAHADPPTPLLVDAWRLGIPQVALLLLVYLGGRAALDNRRWLARRWPRVVGYLDRGKVWNVLSSAITLAGTLLPLAISGDLTRAALVAQLAASASLYVHSTRRPADEGSAAS
mgnify:FL=1